MDEFEKFDKEPEIDTDPTKSEPIPWKVISLLCVIITVFVAYNIFTKFSTAANKEELINLGYKAVATYVIGVIASIVSFIAGDIQDINRTK